MNVMTKHDELGSNKDTATKTSGTSSKHVQNEIENPVPAESSSKQVQNKTENPIPAESSSKHVQKDADTVEISDDESSSLSSVAEKWEVPLITRGKNKGKVRNNTF
jgi:hypothetical protein